MSEPTREQPEVAPEVTTVPAGSGWSRVPDHLGAARTSTVVLAVLFVAIFALYLNIRPDTTGTSTAGTGDNAPSQAPATPPESTPTLTPTPETTAEPTPTEEAPTTSAPTDTTVPEGTTTSDVPAPTETAPPTLPTPTVTTPAG
jgi:cytoskeletal protein RodZ